MANSIAKESIPENEERNRRKKESMSNSIAKESIEEK